MNLEHFLSAFGAAYIQSRSNPKTVLLAGLSEKKNRESAGLFLAEGVKLTLEALRWAEVETVIVSQSAAEQPDSRADEAAGRARERGIPVLVFADAAFEKITTEKAPQGLIAVVRMPRTPAAAGAFTEWQRGRRLLMLDELRDPGNLGTILRSAEAMGVTGVILSGCADVYSQKTVRAAMGTLFRMPLWITGGAEEGAECVRLLKSQGRRVLAVALGEHTLTLGEYEPEAADCPVIGNEGHGISEPVLRECTACVRIPMAGETESLNAAAAAAVILWESFRKKQK